MSSVRQGPAAPTPNELIESERDRQGSISLLRRRAFEESARQQRDRESAIHHELQAALGLGSGPGLGLRLGLGFRGNPNPNLNPDPDPNPNPN